MGKFYPAISQELQVWISSQKVFFVATAPLAAGGRVNCSPKGGDTFRVLSAQSAAYLDLTGSGIETIAHLKENGRIVILFCAFEGGPKIVRLHGRGSTIYPEDPAFAELAARFGAHAGVRSIILIEVERVSDSCGFGVPLMDFRAERSILETWAVRKGPEGVDAYRREHNRRSIDGLPGYRAVGNLPLFASDVSANSSHAPATTPPTGRGAESAAESEPRAARAEVTVRPLSLDDYDAVYRLWADTEGLSLGEEDTREGIAFYLRRNPGLSFVAVRQGEFVGTLLCGHDGRRGILRHLAVDRAHRRQGIAQRLVREGLAALAGEGITRCNLAVLTVNAEGQRFWERQGFSLHPTQFNTLQIRLPPRVRS